MEIIRDFFRLHKNDEAEKIQYVIKLQSLAFDCLRGTITEYLRPVAAKEPRSFSGNTPLKKLEEMYTVEKIRMEWNPSAVEVFQFCNKAGNAGLYGSQHNAAWMLYFCTAAIEKNAVPDYVQDSILEAFAGLDDDVVKTWKKYTLTPENKLKGTNTTKKRAEQRRQSMKTVVFDLLRNLAKSGMKDSEIATYLMDRDFHKFGETELSKKTMTRDVEKIREEFKQS